VRTRATIAEPVVITGVGLITSVGKDRESVWRAVRRGESNFQFLRGLQGIPDGEFIGAPITRGDEIVDGRLRVLTLCERAAGEAIEDANLNLADLDPYRVGCAISGHMGDGSGVEEVYGLRPPDNSAAFPWWKQWLPSTACSVVAHKYDLRGPRLCHSTACASSLIGVLSARRMIIDGQCDVAVVGGAETISPVFVAGFNRLRVLARDVDPHRACRPFDRTRKGFVFGEGSAVLVIERLGSALRRGARIYAEISAAKAASQAHHVTGLDADSESLAYLIRAALAQAELDPEDIGYVNAHGTGTEQNDVAEARAIRQAFGSLPRDFCVSATKSILGHMINAAGAAELAVTALALRDGFAPPTLNLTDPDPECQFDALPLVGRARRFQHAMKLSLAFGGHLVAVVLSRWNDAASGFAYPPLAKAA
jgi:3-oxoacyl-(acyl-carrier-protein) synthase